MSVYTGNLVSRIEYEYTKGRVKYSILGTVILVDVLGQIIIKE